MNTNKQVTQLQTETSLNYNQAGTPADLSNSGVSPSGPSGSRWGVSDGISKALTIVEPIRKDECKPEDFPI